jgi:hypothetical protein
MRARLAAPDRAERLLLGWPNGSVYDRDGSTLAVRRIANERLLGVGSRLSASPPASESS